MVQRGDILKPRTRPRWTGEMDDAARLMRDGGKKVPEIASVLGVSETLVRRKLHQKKNAESSEQVFNIGDRVIYHANVYGNADIDGWIGEVIYVDGTRCPYTVRFDQAWIGGMTEERLINTEESFMKCWFCREENLELLQKKTKVRQTT